MSEFKAIETQEQFEELLKPRLARERETARKKAFEELQPQIEEANSLKSQIATLEESAKQNGETIKGLQAQLAEAQETAKTYETKALRTQVVVDNKLPIEFAERLQGTTAEELQQDAENLAHLLASSNRNFKGLPRANADDKVPADPKEKAYHDLLNNLRGE